MQDDRAESRVREFAGALLALKERTPHSYETLAARLGISRSALHRYCSGRAVPADFDVVRLLARLAGAYPDEVVKLTGCGYWPASPGWCRRCRRFRQYRNPLPKNRRDR